MKTGSIIGGVDGSGTAAIGTWKHGALLPDNDPNDYISFGI